MFRTDTFFFQHFDLWLANLQVQRYRAIYSLSRSTMLTTYVFSERKGTLSITSRDSQPCLAQNFTSLNLIWHLRLTLFECQWYGGLATQFTEGWCTWKIILSASTVPFWVIFFLCWKCPHSRNYADFRTIFANSSIQ